MKKAEIIDSKFNRLVENAFDFLEQSIDELKDKPKFSVIHFHASIELFLKARLMAEHWTLVISSKREADWEKFINGDFISVTLEESFNKLDKIVQSPIPVKAHQIFKKITNHRNQMVHFYHASETVEIQGKEVQKIVKEQFLAWYFLHDLLLVQWKEIFSEYAEKIKRISLKLKKHRLFLQVKYEELKSTIDDLITKGNKCFLCPSCNFKSDIHLDEKTPLYESECLVCDLAKICLVFDCSHCNQGKAIFKSEPYAKCDHCSYIFVSGDIKEKFVNNGDAYIAMKEGIFDYFPINCGACSGYESVVEISEDELLCIECFNVSSEYGNCEWCNESSTELSEDSYLLGCEFCDGRIDWDKDD